MDITVPTAEDRILQTVENITDTYKDRDVRIVWITSGDFIRAESDPTDEKPGFSIEIRPGRVEVSSFQVEASDDPSIPPRRLSNAPVVIEADKTGGIESGPFKYLVEKILKAVEDYKASIPKASKTETDLDGLL